MQLPDEAIAYQFHSLLVPGHEEWTPAAELRAQHLLPPQALKDLLPRLTHVKSQVAAERELQMASPNHTVPPHVGPLPPRAEGTIGSSERAAETVEAGFIDWPQKTLDNHRRKGEASALGQVLRLAARLREQSDRVVVLGCGGAHLGARALFEALKSTHHNEHSAEARLGVPRIYFEGHAADNDALHELQDLLQQTCVDPALREERWGLVVVSKSGNTLETATAYRMFRREMLEFYGHHSRRCQELVVPITGATGRLRELCKADGIHDEDVLTMPDTVGANYAALTPAGLLPAAMMGLDARALLLGAVAMTRRFLEEPFERNPVLQYAAVNYLMTAQRHKPIRVLSIWSKKLQALGHWYDHLLSTSLGKSGHGPTPITTVQARDWHGRVQQFQEGPRDKIINNLTLKTPRQPPVMIGMMDHNHDDLNQFNRKSLPDLVDASLRAVNQAHAEAVRPTADLVLPSLSEHTMGQLMQMLMLATVVEGRLMGINPYGQPAVDSLKKKVAANLKG